jgi:hypothetical protein
MTTEANFPLQQLCLKPSIYGRFSLDHLWPLLGDHQGHTSQQFNANLLAHFYSAPVAWFCSTLDINFSAFPEEHPSC